MGEILKLIFVPPPMPKFRIPRVYRMINPSFKEDLGNAFNLVYFRGVYDGFIACSVVALLVILVLVLLARWNVQTKEGEHAKDRDSISGFLSFIRKNGSG